MEVSASKVLNSIIVALGTFIESHVTCDRNVPEHVDMTSNQDEPMQNELRLLLYGDLGFALFDTGIAIVISIHLLQEVLSRISLHVKIRSLDCLESNGH